MNILFLIIRFNLTKTFSNKHNKCWMEFRKLPCLCCGKEGNQGRVYGNNKRPYKRDYFFCISCMSFQGTSMGHHPDIIYRVK